MNRQRLMEMFNAPQRVVTLSTADGDGNPNGAILGSARMTDEQSVVIALGSNRTLANLRVNPKGAITFFEPGPSLLQWKGARLYLEVERIEEQGETFDRLLSEVAATAGETAAKTVRAAVIFRITAVRPLIDMTA